MSYHTEKPLVSIVTVVFNGVNTIERTIRSVIDQSYDNIEYIIIDGASTDGTLEIIYRYKEHVSIIISEKDRGIADAMNKGIALANGQIIGLINADDWFEKDSVREVIKASITCPDAIIHGDMRVYMNASTYYLEKGPVSPNLIKGMELNHPTVFVPKTLYKRYGNFDTTYRIVFDWEFMLRLKLDNVVFVKLSQILANFSVGGVSTIKSKELIEEMHVIRKKYKVYRFIDKYYVINKMRLVFFGSSVIKISQKIRFIKHYLNSRKASIEISRIK